MDFIIAAGILDEKENPFPLKAAYKAADNDGFIYDTTITETEDSIIVSYAVEDKKPEFCREFLALDEPTTMPELLTEIETTSFDKNFISSITESEQDANYFAQVFTGYDEIEDTTDLSFFNLYYGVERTGVTVKTTVINRLKVNTTVQSLPARLQITTEIIRNTLDYPTYTPEITLIVNPEGSGIAEIVYLYDQGRSVSVRAYTEELGYEFDYWSDASGILSYNSEYQLCIPELNYFLTANFVYTAFTYINVSANISEDIYISGGGSYTPGDIVTLETRYTGNIIDFEDGTIPALLELDSEEYPDGLGFIQSDEAYSGEYALTLWPEYADWSTITIHYSCTRPTYFSAKYKIYNPPMAELSARLDFIADYQTVSLYCDYTTDWETLSAYLYPGDNEIIIYWRHYVWGDNSLYAVFDDFKFNQPGTDPIFMGWVANSVTLSTASTLVLTAGEDNMSIEAIYHQNSTTMSTVNLSTNKPGHNFMWGSGTYSVGESVTVETASINTPINFSNGKLPDIVKNFEIDVYGTENPGPVFSDSVYLTGARSLEINLPTESAVFCEGGGWWNYEAKFIASVASLTTVALTYNFIGDQTSQYPYGKFNSTSKITLSATPDTWTTYNRTVSTTGFTGSYYVTLGHMYRSAAENPGKLYLDSVQFYCNIPDPIFLGWHDGITTVSTSPTYTFTMPNHSVSLEAIYE